MDLVEKVKANIGKAALVAAIPVIMSGCIEPAGRIHVRIPMGYVFCENPHYHGGKKDCHPSNGPHTHGQKKKNDHGHKYHGHKQGHGHKHQGYHHGHKKHKHRIRVHW
jgi:hypothetical protein